MSALQPVVTDRQPPCNHAERSWRHRPRGRSRAEEDLTKVKTQRLVAALVVVLATAVVLVGAAHRRIVRTTAQAFSASERPAGRLRRQTGSSGPWRGAPHRSCARTIVLALSALGGIAPAIVASAQPARPEEGAGIRGARAVATSLVPVVSGDSSGFDWADVYDGGRLRPRHVPAGAAAATLAARHRRHVTLP